ncbi:MAG: Gfo/Idh/MocA family oxidoreductase, partial [Planctomycetaceae bacterium]|nr:Gfo/Idh/MocA family oxidoreductase [Planctomycetaceae bacterium]
GAAMWVGTQSSARAYLSPLQRLNAACVGVGGKGSSDASHVNNHGATIVGICDVDKGTLDKKGGDPGFTYAKRFQDFREMLDQMGDQIDLVTVSTPDHTHAAAAIKAMKMGKHVYCQKPLTWSIYEARRMREVAEETGVVTQMGNQGTSEDGLRETVEIVRSGGIGEVKAVHIWTNRPIWPQGIGRPEGQDPVPASLDWDCWIGPAPMRPYKQGVYHSFNWRGWCDFGTGALGDMACHTANATVMALDLWDPVALTAIKNPGIVGGETYPGNSHLMFEFPARGQFSACEFHWYDGGNMPGEDILPTSAMPESYQKRIAKVLSEGKNRLEVMKSGALIVGSKGMLFSPNDYGAQFYLLPEKEFADYKRPEQTLPRIQYKGDTDMRHKYEFISAIKGEGKTMSNFGYAGRLTETILCGNLALRAGEGQRVEWDAKNLKVTNVPELNQFVGREYRDGWSI